MAQPLQIKARRATDKEKFHGWDMEERYFVDRGVDAWLKEEGRGCRGKNGNKR